jgi:hypothetical protein
LAGLDLGDVEHGIDEAQEVLTVRSDAGEGIERFWALRLVEAFLDEFGIPENGRERCHQAFAKAKAIRGAELVARTKLCTGCNEHHPLEAFLSSAFTPDKLTDKCLPAIRRAAQQDREARERRLAEVQAKVAAEPSTKLRCRTCKAEKPAAQFSPHRLSKTGHRKDCKACVRDCRIKHQQKSAAQKERDREMRTQPHRRIANRLAVAAWQAKNPRAVTAKIVLAQAVRSGTVKKAATCEAEGCDRTDLSGHHHTYYQPRSAIWLCSACPARA